MACEHPLKLMAVLRSDISGRTASRGQFVKCPACGAQLALRGKNACRWAKTLIPCAALMLWIFLDVYALYEIRVQSARQLVRVAALVSMAVGSWVFSEFLCLRKRWYTVAPPEPGEGTHANEL